MNVEKGKEKIKSLKKELAQAVQDALDDRTDVTSRHVTELRAELAKLEKEIARYKRGEAKTADDEGEEKDGDGDESDDILDMAGFFNS